MTKWPPRIATWPLQSSVELLILQRKDVIAKFHLVLTAGETAEPYCDEVAAANRDLASVELLILQRKDGITKLYLVLSAGETAEPYCDEVAAANRDLASVEVLIYITTILAFASIIFMICLCTRCCTCCCSATQVCRDAACCKSWRQGCEGCCTACGFGWCDLLPLLLPVSLLSVSLFLVSFASCCCTVCRLCWCVLLSSIDVARGLHIYASGLK